MPDLRGKIAVVTGASRGVGKGIAEGLGEAGAIVYVTGRTTQEGDAALPGTIHATAAAVNELGGRGIAVQCDHSRDEEIRALFERVRAEHGRLDVLVNNVFKIPDPPEFFGPFWKLPISIWDDMLGVGLRGHYVASVYAAPVMVERGSGLIVNISSFGGAGYAFSAAYGVGKGAVDRLAKDMAVDLKPHGVTAVSLWPGVVKTEFLLEQVAKRTLGFDMSNAESPRFSGRAVAALAADPRVLERTGRVLVVAELAREYGFTDLDGRIPKPLATPR